MRRGIGERTKLSTARIAWAPVARYAAGRTARDRHTPELDGIRGIACLLVVLMHCGLGITSPTFWSWQPWVWRTLGPFMVGGVDLFFVLSGFLIGGILMDHKNAPNYFQVFWVRRAARILPLYSLVLLTYIVALHTLKTPWADRWLLQNPLPLWGYATFTINNIMAAKGDTGALWIGITWTLAIEEQFYLCFPFIIYFCQPRTVRIVAAAAIVAAPFVRQALWQATGVAYVGYFATPGRIDTLMLGVLCAYCVRSQATMQWIRKVQRAIEVTVSVLCVLISGVFIELPRTIAYSALALVFTYAILRIDLNGWRYRKVLRSSFLVEMGQISFALYMCHQAVNGMIHGLLAGQVPVIEGWRDLSLAGLVVAISVALAELSTRFFERPFRRVGRRFAYKPPDAPDVTICAVIPEKAA